MSEILEIIDKTFLSKLEETNFYGDIYFNQNNALNIDRKIFNKLINKFNAASESTGHEWRINLDSELFLVFVNEIFEDNSGSWTRMDRNYYLSTIIHENAIWSTWLEETEGYDKKTDDYTNIGWESVDHVELLEEVTNNNYSFRFYFKNDTQHFDLFSNRFGTYDLNTCRVIEDLLNKIIKKKNETINDSIKKYDELVSLISNSVGIENYSKGLELLEKFENLYEIEDISNESTHIYYFGKVTSLIGLGEFEDALRIINSFINKFEGSETPPYALELKGQILLKTNNFVEATNYLTMSTERYEEITDKKDALVLKEESYSKLKEVFLEIPYDKRKLLFIGADIYATQSSEMIVIKKNDLPFNIKFPIGHPHLNEIYTCHPHKQNLYLPLKDYSEELFLDRINEFSYLLQCLGAKSLEISSSKSNSSDQRATSKTEVDANIDYKINSANVNYKGENTENTLIDGNLKISKKQVFKPVKAPFIPANLIWYHSDLNWQRLVDQRLNGNIMTHREVISSSQSENISSHELKQIDAELKLLLPKIGVTCSSENDINTSTLKTHEWILTVEFEDIDNLLIENKIENKLLSDKNSKNKEVESNLEKYKEDVLLMIEDDGIIDDMERNILNRKIKKYGISKADATAVENDLLTSVYSENELQYIQEIKEFLEDGEISEIERKILNRYALKFGLEKEKQLEIDKIFISN
jgi:hypothetical protein